MSRPAVVFPDPRLAAVTYLRAALPPYTGAIAIRTKDPGKYDPRPYLIVRAQTPSTRYPVVETVPLHVTVWAAEDFTALDVAQKARAVLLSFPGDASVRGYYHRLGPAPGSDPDNGEPLASFMVASSLKPLPL